MSGFILCFVVLTAASACSFLNLSELQELLVGILLDEFLQASELLNVSTLDASVVSTLAYFRNNAGALDTLGKAANYVRTTFVVILNYFNIGCHMWA